MGIVLLCPNLWSSIVYVFQVPGPCILSLFSRQHNRLHSIFIQWHIPLGFEPRNLLCFQSLGDGRLSGCWTLGGRSLGTVCWLGPTYLWCRWLRPICPVVALVLSTCGSSLKCEALWIFLYASVISEYLTWYCGQTLVTRSREESYIERRERERALL